MLDWFKETFMGALGPVLAFFTAIFNPAIAIVVGIWQGCQFVYEMIGKGSTQFDAVVSSYNGIMALVGGSVFGQLPPQLGAAIGFLNAFLPVTEALILVALGIVIYTLCVVLRMLKSWIPTVA